MTDWADLAAELDAWSGDGQVPTLWWRDDDATVSTAELARLYELSHMHGIPLTLAVIPENAEESVCNGADIPPGISVVQHGFSHMNHEPPERKKSEFGMARDRQRVCEDIATGHNRLKSFNGFFPAFVPPWNRIQADFYGELVRNGIVGLSAFGARARATPVAGLRQANTHVDIVDWSNSRDFAGVAVVCGQLVSHLSARRMHICDPAEATGLLTHHLVHTPACWAFLDALFDFIKNQARVRWLGGPEVFTL